MLYQTILWVALRRLPHLRLAFLYSYVLYDSYFSWCDLINKRLT